MSERIKPGGRVREFIDQFNDLASQSDASRLTSSEQDAMGGSAGIQLASPDELRIELFEVLNNWSINTDENAGPLNWPKTTARSVRFSYPDGWDTPSALHITDVTIWCPQAFQPPLASQTASYSLFSPRYLPGDWVYCIANPLSGKWEVVSGGGVRFGYAQLQEQVNSGGKGSAIMYTVDTQPDGNWTLSNASDDNITVYAPPLALPGQYYPSGMIVTVAWNTRYQRWVIWDRAVGGC